MKKVDSINSSNAQDHVADSEDEQQVTIQASEKMRLIKSLYRDDQLTDATVRIGVLLIDHVHSDLGCAFVGFDSIRDQTGKSSATIAKAVAQLVERGWFVVGKGTARSRRYPRNLYYPNWDRRYGLEDTTNVVAFPSKKDRDQRLNASESEATFSEPSSQCKAGITSQNEAGSTSKSEVYTVNHQTVKGHTDKEEIAFSPPPASPAAPSPGAGESNKSPSGKRTGKAPVVVRNPLNWPENAHAQFFNAFPPSEVWRPGDVGYAKRMLDKLKKEGRVPFRTILEGAARYAEYCEEEFVEMEFMVRPGNWLIGERWEDELDK